jgi:hypothetical protein
MGITLLSRKILPTGSNSPRTTECSQFLFGFYPDERREIRAQFDGGAITSGGSGLLPGRSRNGLGFCSM